MHLLEPSPSPGSPVVTLRATVRQLLEDPERRADTFCAQWGHSALLHLPDDELVERALLRLGDAATTLASRPHAPATQSLIMLRAFHTMVIDFLAGPVGDVVLGRGPDAQLRLTDESVSKRHAVLRWSPAGVQVRDVGSLNGTELNGAPVSAAATLTSGDLLRVGDAALVFVTSQILFLQLESVRHSVHGAH